MPVSGTPQQERIDTGIASGKNVARNSALGIVGQLAIRALSVVFGIAIVRRFGSETFGQYAAALAFVSLFSVLSDLGLGSWGTRAVAEDRASTSALVWRVAGIRLLLSAMTTAVIVGLAALLYPAQHLLAIIVACGTLFLFGINGAFDMAWLGNERLAISSTVSVINQVAFVAIGSAVLIFHGGVIALILASIAALCIATTASWRMGKRLLGLTAARPTLRGAWPLVCACAPIGIVQISLLISYKVDTVFLSIFRDDATVGIYAVAYNLIFSLMLLSHSVNLALFPALSRTANDPTVLERLVSRAMRYLLIVSIPIAFGGALLAPALIRSLYTDVYAQSATVLQIVIWVLPLMFLTEFLGYYVTAIHRERAASRAAIVMAIANVGLNLVCIPRFGIWAAAIITVITEIVFLIQYLWILRDRHVIRIFSALAWRPVVAAGVMVVVLAVAPFGFPPLAICLGMIVYGALLLFLGVVTRSEIAAMSPLSALRARQASKPIPAEGFGYED